MFLHSFKSRLKIIANDKMSLFWMVFFPLILATFFNMAFSNIKETTFEAIDVALCDISESDTIYTVLNSTEMFNITLTDIENGKDLLYNGKVSGIISGKDELKLIISGNGLNQSIIKNILDSYQQSFMISLDIISKDPSVLQTDFLDNIGSEQSFTSSMPIGNDGHVDIMVVFFYSLLGMATIMGANHMIGVVNSLQANQSPLAARVCCAPIKKSISLIANMAAVFVIEMISISLCLFYMSVVLGLNLGSDVGHILLLLFVGSAMSIAFGSFISMILKASEGIKNGILVGATMLWSTMSGMMSNAVKFYLDTYAPILQKLNPVNLITDGLYSLFFYGVNDRYFTNLVALGGLAVLFCILTFVVSRRQRYASI